MRGMATILSAVSLFQPRKYETNDATKHENTKEANDCIARSKHTPHSGGVRNEQEQAQSARSHFAFHSGSVASMRRGSSRHTFPWRKLDSHTDPMPTRTASPPGP